MMVYKFQDDVDGKFAFVIAESSEQAREKLKETTNLPLLFIGSKELSECTPIIWINNILPF